MYEIEGVQYSESDLIKIAEIKGISFDELLQNPKIKQVKTSGVDMGATTPLQEAPVMESNLEDGSLESQDPNDIISQEENTWLENTLGKNVVTDYFSDLYRGFKSGYNQAASMDETFNLMRENSSVTEETSKEFVDAILETQKTPVSDEMQVFQKVYEESGGGVFGFLKGTLTTRGQVLPQVMASSIGTMLGSAMTADEVAKAGIAGAAAGGAATAMIGGVGALPGLVTGVVGAMESGFTYAELIQTELEKQNKEFTKENVVELLSNEETFKSLRNRAIGRGVTIGAVEGLANAISGGAASAIRGTKGLARVGKVATTLGAESAGGGLGEVAGRIVAGQEMDVAEIGFEATAGLAGAPISFAKAIAAKPEYILNGEKVSKEQVLDFIESDDGENIATSSIKIKNDDQTLKLGREKINKARAKKVASKVISDEKDLTRFVDLENERATLDTSSFIGKKRAKEIDSELDDIYARNSIKEEDIRVEKAKVFAETLMKEEVGKVKSFGGSIRILNSDQIKEEFSEKEAEANAFVDSKTNKIVINKDNAGKTFYVTSASHEMLHNIIRSNFIVRKQENGELNSEDIDRINKLINDFKSSLDVNTLNRIQKRIDENYRYKEDGSEKELHEYAEEYITSLSDIIGEDGKTVSSTTLDKIKSFIKDLFSTFGLTDTQFKSGDDIIDFVKEYRVNIQQGKLSKRAKAMMALDVKSDAKASNVNYSKGQQALNDRVNNLVGQKDADGKYKWKSKEEFQGSKEFQDVYYNIIEGDLIDPLIRRGIEGDAVYGLPIQDFVAQVKDELVGTLMRFDPSKNNSLIGFINSQLRYRKNDIIKRRAEIKSESSIDVEQGEAGFVSRADYAVEENFDEAIDITDEEINTESTLIDPADMLGPEGQSQVRKALEERLSEVDEEKIKSFKSVPMMLADILAEYIGINPSKITDPKKNLSTAEAKAIQKFIFDNAETIIKLLPQGAVTGAAEQTLIGTSTGVQKNLLKNFYRKATERRTEAQGLYEFELLEDINLNDFLEVFAIDPEGNTIAGFSPRNPEGQNLKAIIRQLDQLMTNTAYRKMLQENGANANKIQDIASGKSVYQYSKGETILRSKKDVDDFIDRFTRVREKSLLGYDITSQTIQNIVKRARNKTVRKLLEDNLDALENDLLIENLVNQGIRGYAYEKLVLNNLTKIAKNIPDLEVLQTSVQRNNKFADLKLRYKGLEFFVELKLDTVAQLGSIGTSSYVTDIVQNIEKTSVEGELKILAKKSETFKKFLEENAQNVSNGKIELTEEEIEKYKIDKTFAKIRKELSLNTDERVVKDIYVTNKDTLYINFGDGGTYALDENNNPLNLPVFKGDINLVTRLVPGSTKKNGKKTIFLRSFPILKEGWIENNKSNANFYNKEGVENHFKDYSMPTQETLEQAEQRMAAILSNMDSRYNAGQTLDRATAKNLAATRSKRRDILSPSADDFVGLLYRFLDKGKLGEEQYKFFEDNLIKPFAKAYYALNAKRQLVTKSYKNINKNNPEVVKKLKQDSGFGGFTFEQALRVWLFQKANYSLSGLNEDTQKALVTIVKNNPDIQSYGEQLSGILAIEEYWVEPDAKNWQVDTIKSDMVKYVEKVSRKKMLQGWIENKNAIFSENNMNKIEATYGPDFRAALEDMLYRMENGTSRPEGTNKQINQFLNWIRGSVAVTMFFNTRSAILQQLSNINFLNWGDNNPIKAATALANIDQYAKDWAYIFNSDYLKERRGGLKTDVNAADLADAIRKGGVKGLHARLLQLGFSLTQLGDSFAIATGGATFLRNRINTYLSQGLDAQQAEQQAFLDFQEISEETQQSARPDRLAKQQTDEVGRIFLAFQNTPMQYTRIITKAAKDLIAGRGDKKTNISKIAYYMIIQNIAFSAMQTALFGMLFEDEEEDPDIAEQNEKKIQRIINNSIDTVIRGTGLYGAVLSTAKNIILKFVEQERRQEEGKGRADHAYTLIEGLNVSPPIGIKARQMYGSIQNYRYNKDVIDDMGFSINNPVLDVAGSASAFALNIPLDRAVSKIRNLKAASDAETETWAKIALALGWNTWNVGIENEELKKVKAENKKQRELQRKQIKSSGSKKFILNEKSKNKFNL